MSTAESADDRAKTGDHVATYDFDIFLDPGLLEDPHRRVTQLIRDAPPVFWTNLNGGHWVATQYEDAFKIMHETETFSSLPYSPEQKQMMIRMFPANAPRMPDIIPVLSDPPEHGKFRAPLQRAFAPSAVMKLQGEVEDLTNQLIDAVIDQGCCDFIVSLGEPLPVRIFLKLMGLPEDRLSRFRDLVRMVLAPGHNPRELAMRIRHVADAMADVIVAKRSAPGDDLISRLWATQIDDKPLTQEQMEDYAVNLFLGGLDTITNAMGFGIRHLASDAGFQNRLRQDVSLIPETVEEFLRRYSFVIPRRRITRDTIIQGQRLKAGHTVFVYQPAAALDERVFPDPEVFDVARSRKAHMAFGIGPHTCVGAHLARMELQTLFRVVLQRLPTFRLDPDKQAKFHAGTIFAVASLPDPLGLKLRMRTTELCIKPLDIGAEVAGLKAGSEEEPDVRAILYEAWLRYGILVFSDIESTPRHLALSRCFGELEMHPVPQLRSDEHPLLAEIGGRKRKAAYVYDGVVLASRIAWHRDTAYKLELCKGGVLRMVEIPSSGGETLFADTALAYDDLPAAVKEQLQGMEYKSTMHSSPINQTRPGAFWKTARLATREEDPLAAYFDLESSSAARPFPSVVYPVVIAHAESGRKCIFLSPTYVDCFLGMPQRESDELLEYLVAHMLRPRYVYRHRWSVNQCIAWDNHRFMHAALGHDPLEPRRALRTTLIGSVRTGSFYDSTAGASH